MVGPKHHSEMKMKLTRHPKLTNRRAIVRNEPAAQLAPATLSRSLHPPSTSLRSGRVQPHRRRRLCSEGSEHGPLVSTRFRVRRRVPGGDPAPSLGSRDHLSRRRRRVGVALRLRSGPRLRSLRSLRRGRMAPRCAKPRARPEGSGRPSPRGTTTRAAPRQSLRSLCCAECRHGRRSFAPPLERDSAAARRPFRRCALR